VRTDNVIRLRENTREFASPGRLMMAEDLLDLVFFALAALQASQHVHRHVEFPGGFQDTPQSADKTRPQN
jgi:hypothetical protein